MDASLYIILKTNSKLLEADKIQWNIYSLQILYTSNCGGRKEELGVERNIERCLRL